MNWLCSINNTNNNNSNWIEIDSLWKFALNLSRFLCSNNRSKFHFFFLFRYKFHFQYRTWWSEKQIIYAVNQISAPLCSALHPSQQNWVNNWKVIDGLFVPDYWINSSERMKQRGRALSFQWEMLMEKTYRANQKQLKLIASIVWHNFIKRVE